jgi:protein-S-isoprenylcysteine O-methyltransferase Ste14
MVQQQKEFQSGPLPPVYFMLASASMLVLHFTLPVRKWLPRPWNLAGIAPLIAGVVLILIADQQFKEHGTTIKPFQASSTLVTDGVFRYTRNPMYLGMVIMLLGISICLASIPPLFVVPAFAWIMVKKFIRPEEHSLEQQFGQAYIEYKSRVHRWV